MRAPSVEALLEAFGQNLGPLKVAFARLEEGGPALAADLADLMRRHDRGENRGLAAPAGYLEVVVHRR